MSTRIKQLSPLIANQIAAGEVIERPASVVKELLENSQDAGALNIGIELGFAGLNLIKISDDGEGICQEDLPLSIKQHATSKISCLDDLYSIQSMGFRGEALASISAVAKLSITSRTVLQQHAAKLEIQDEKLIISPCARSVGTTVEVLDLFYNAPVRKNFLRGQRTELQCIEDIIKRFALAAPNITITVKHNNKEILKIPASICTNTKLVRVKKIFGSKFVDSAIAVDFASHGMRVYGLLGSPDYQRSQKDKQWIYLNNRMLRDKLLQHAIMQIYHDHLPSGRFPACLLYLDMPPDFVDVNVHPTKHEVRFKNPRDVHDFLISSLSVCIRPLSKLAIESEVQGYSERRTVEYTSVHEDLSSESTQQFVSAVEFRNRYIEQKPLLKTETDHVFKHEVSKSKLQHIENIYVLNSRFAIFYQGSESYIVDFAKLYRNYCRNILINAVYPLLSRPLLVPVQYAFKPNMYDIFNNSQSLIAEFGITFNFFDNDKLIIRSIPQCFPQLDLKIFFDKIDSIKIINKLELANLIIDCQVFDAKLSSYQEKVMLLDYLKEKNLTKYTRHLNNSLCQNLFEYVSPNL